MSRLKDLNGYTPIEPKPLLDWVCEQQTEKVTISHNMFESGFKRFIQFIWRIQKRYGVKENQIECIGIHMSKSILMPIVKITLVEGTTIEIFYNFYEYEISIDGKEPVGILDDYALFAYLYTQLPIAYCKNPLAYEVA